MALNSLLGMTVGVPAPQNLDGFYEEIGLVGGNGRWGSADFAEQIHIEEAPYRQLKEMRLACDEESELAEITKRCEALGAKAEQGQGKIRVTDPINGWDVTVEPHAPLVLAEQPVRVQNRPGARQRVGARAELITEEKPRPPRRLGHVVVGTPKPIETAPLYLEGIGYRLSDNPMGIANFMRCSPDHHNLLIAPGPVPYLNHYALEMDDLDAVVRAGTLYLREHDDRHIAGPGRHQIGGNQFWYMKDPSGAFFELFSDMDYIEDDEAWEPRSDWDMSDSWSLWGDKDQPEVFFQPVDIREVIDGYTKANG